MWPPDVVGTFIPRSSAPSGSVGVAARANDPTQLHCGIVYARASGPHLLHLRWDDDLKLEPLPGDDLVANSGLHVENQKVVNKLCANIARVAKDSVHPWGFGYKGGAPFARTGSWKDAPESMTCASFVIAVFESAGFPLVNLDTWPERDDDRHFMRGKAARLEEPAKRLRESAAAETAKRIRPEEAAVAVAAGERQLPLNFTSLESVAVELRERLRTRYIDGQRTRFGADVASALDDGDLASLLRRGVAGLATSDTSRLAGELDAGAPLTHVLCRLMCLILRRAPSDLVSDEELDAAARDECRCTELEARVRARAGDRQSEPIHDLIGLLAADDHSG